MIIDYSKLALIECRESTLATQTKAVIVSDRKGCRV